MLFKDEKSVIDYFTSLKVHNATRMMLKQYDEGIFVDTKVRKMILTGPNQGRVTIEGTVQKFVFDNLGGGVYKCTIGPIS